MIKKYSLSPHETKKQAKNLAEKILKTRTSGPCIIGLRGSLGSGKTMFVKGFARALGIRSRITSPTFLIKKKYIINKRNFSIFIHADMYRVKKISELLVIGFMNDLKDNRAIVLVEWADVIKKILPKKIMWVTIEHGKKENERFIKTK
jgi:tRNA threonylcarbamoyladenosine biosynthesis protein TsaE